MVSQFRIKGAYKSYNFGSAEHDVPSVIIYPEYEIRVYNYPSIIVQGGRGRGSKINSGSMICLSDRPIAVSVAAGVLRELSTSAFGLLSVQFSNIP